MAFGTYGTTPAVKTAPPKPPRVNPLAGLITNPVVAAAGNARDQAIQDANAQLRQLRSQALINFGSPELAQQLGGTVDPNTAAAAGANQYSILANLAHQNLIAGRQLLDSLAGHGLLHSGATGYQQGEQARNYVQALYTAGQNLLSQLNQYLGNYLGTSQAANNNYVSALLNAFQAYGQNPLGQF